MTQGGSVASARSTLDATRELLARAQALAADCERPDIADSLAQAVEGTTRPETLVCVAGEFKRGKSALVNAFLGRDVCPVDDDVATAAVTVVKYASEPGALVRWRASREPSAERVPLERLSALVTEFGDAELRRDIELVEVGLPHALLERGLTLVDTPGIGGLSAAHGAATLAFLPMADLLLFICDASAELSPTELVFLRRSYETCPSVIAVLTKIDLYPEWRRIVDLNRRHLHAAGIEVPIVPISSRLRAVAVERSDPGINVESGLPALVAAMQERGLARTERVASRRGARQIRLTLAPLRDAYARSLATGPSSGGSGPDIHQARARVEQVRSAGLRWRQLIVDGFNELTPDVDHRLNTALREIARDFDEQVGNRDPATEWPQIAEELQRRVADAVQAAYSEIQAGTTATAQRVAALLPEEAFGASADGATIAAHDPRAHWLDREITTVSIVGQLGQAFTALRGAYGGLLMFGMLANAAGVVVVGPALVGVGALFGGRQLLEVRRRALDARRQEARRFVREFIEEVRFEAIAKLHTVARELQRELRDRCTDRIAELARTYTEELERTERAAMQTSQQRDAEAQHLRDRIARLDQLLERAQVLERTA